MRGAETPKRAARALADLDARDRDMPAPAREIIAEGVRRLVAYQDDAYARLYLDRLAPIRDADARARADGRLLRETARHLAVRMSYEDVIRVAQAKIDPARFARIAAEVGVKPGEPVKMFEFLKPGVDELCSMLPPSLARRILAFAERREWLARFHWGMEVDTTSVSGYLRFRTLAALRRLRPRSYRYAEEQRAIESWLGLIAQAATHIRRARARGRRMRAADQGLRRHPQARHRQLPPDRNACDPPGAGGTDPARQARRRGRLGAHRGAGRSRRREPCQVP